MGKSGKKRGRRSAEASNESTPVRNLGGSDEEQAPQKKRRKVPKSSSELADEFGLQDVELVYTDADFQNLTTFSLFVRLFRPQIATVNGKVPSSKMTQLLEAKWREFQDGNPVTKDEEDQEEDGDSPEEEKQDESDFEESPRPSKSKADMSKIKYKDSEEDSDATEIEAPTKQRTRTKASICKRIAAKRGVVMPTVTNDSESEGSGPVKARSGKKDKGKKQTSRKSTPAVSADEEVKASDDDTIEEEEPPKRKSSGLLKIKLTLPSSTRKSKRERKVLKVDDHVEKFFDDSDTQEEAKQKKQKKKAYSDDDDFGADSGNDSSRKTKRRHQKKKKSTSKKAKKHDSDIELVSSGMDPLTDDESRQKTKRRSTQSKRKSGGRRSHKNSDIDQLLSDSDTDMNSDDSRRKSRRKKTKKETTPPEKNRIPGERQSERHRGKGTEEGTSMAEMTDKEFEMMLKKQERDEQREKLRKEKEQYKKEKEDSFKGKKGGWQASSDEIDSGEESDHYWYCQVCKDGGDLILCDGCPRSFHQSCLKMEQLPQGEWKCPICNGEELPEISEAEEEGDTGHDQFCKECKLTGELLLCDFCPFSYHLECLNPALKEVPEGEWKCPRCDWLERPLKGRVMRILTWRWTTINNGNKEDKDHLDHTTSPQKQVHPADKENSNESNNGDAPKLRPERELFCKFEFYAYWDCDWVNQMQIEVHQSWLEKRFCAKWDLEEPPQTEEAGASGKHKTDDKYNLYERYFRWGIKPDWLLIHRILTHEKERGSTRYLVKWRDRTYEEATYEEESDLPEGLADWKKHVNAYWMRRKHVEGSKKDKNKEPEKKPKKKELKKQWEAQPAYVDATGGKLHPYQLVGVNWLRFSFGQGTNTILADEMGLGKTIQAIIFLYSLWREGYTKGPFLISAPLSTVPNWEREFEFWAPEMYVVTYSGSKENRAVLREREFCYRDGAFKMSTFSKPSSFRINEGFKPKFDVLLTSYEYPSLDTVLFSSFLWSAIVIDEAHRLKSNQSLYFRTLSKYKVDYRLLLTGTPLQNNLEELFNLLNFLQKEKFDNLEEFLEEFSDIGKEEQVLRMHSMLAPHMLRRLKADVLKDIPAKLEFIVRVDLSAMQKKYYKLILTKNYQALNVAGYSNQTSLQNIMMDLRKCCCHPYLFPSAVDEAPQAKHGYFEGNALINASGKMDLLAKMLRKLREQGHRVLIFSQMTRVLDLLEDFCVHLDYEYERIDGGIAGNLRQDKIDRFNDTDSSSFVFLLSTRAGGLGINLATADTVIIFDMDWNPHNDIQAFSRAHRIGQKNKVMIYRFVSRNTVEEKMANVCKKKMMLSELIIAKGGTNKSDMANAKKAESLTKQEMNEILKFGAENLFKDDEGGKLVYDDATVEKMLDRTLDDENEGPVKAEGETKVGLNDYLRSFKVAHYQVKEGDEEDTDEEENEEDDEQPSTSKHPEEEKEDPEYWQRVLGDEYSAHMAAMHQQAEELAKTLGKGKRVRKQINYAEQAMIELADKSHKRARVEVLKQQADSGDDFQPSSEDESVDSDELEDVNDDGLKKTDPQRWKLLKKELKKKKMIKAGKEGGPVHSGLKPNELPPLLARVNGQIEVLGFTARQRRAFLDAVMRFGMPPEDGYRSQWLVRDLRNKPERVFKAYVSLFMRHLCEPLQESSEKFADGVPREGLSQQHVLTRVGMIALLKRKVMEYENVNGVNSMLEFTRKEDPQEDIIAIPSTTTDTAESQAEKEDEEKTGKEKDGDKEKDNGEKEKDKDKEEMEKGEMEKDDVGDTEAQKDKEKDKEMSTDEEKSMNEKDKDGDKGETKESEEAEKMDTSVDKKEEDKEEEKREKEEEEKKSKIEEKEEDEKEEEKNKIEEKEEEEKEEEKNKIEEKEEKEKVEDGKDNEKVSEKCQVADEKDSKEETKDKAEKDSEKQDKDSSKEDVEEKMDTSESKEDEKKGESNEDKEEVMEIDSDGKKNEDKDKGKGDKKDKNETKDEDKDQIDLTDSAQKKKDKNETKDEDSDGKKNEEIDKGKGDKKDKNETKDEDKDQIDLTDSAQKKSDHEKSEKETSPEREKSESPEKEKEGEQKEASQEKSTIKKKKKLTETELRRQLRQKYWIADGGFTELHAVWAYEEGLMEPGKEYELWHRRHDYWLLAGVITHGYRHWQDILGDPRFMILNRAFRTEQERLRKAAFLNRRFQLLEQALVIEEQLRKASKENTAFLSPKDIPSEEGGVIDPLSQLDNFAATLRRVSQGQQSAGNPPDAKVHKAINNLSGLINDIKQATYKTMPATLAKAPPANITMPSAAKPVKQAPRTTSQVPRTIAQMQKAKPVPSKAAPVITID